VSGTSAIGRHHLLVRPGDHHHDCCAEGDDFTQAVPDQVFSAQGTRSTKTIRRWEPRFPGQRPASKAVAPRRTDLRPRRENGKLNRRGRCSAAALHDVELRHLRLRREHRSFTRRFRSIVLRNGRTHGIFWTHAPDQRFDIGASIPGSAVVVARRRRTSATTSSTGGSQGGDQPLHQLTGRMPMPPLWALGYHQCRYQLFPRVARPLHCGQLPAQRNIPADAIWLDIHFTWTGATRSPGRGAVSGSTRH
jgi:hypothetical protein